MRQCKGGNKPPSLSIFSKKSTVQLSHSFSQFYSQNRFDTVVDTLQVQKFLFANHKIKYWEETLEHKYKLTVSA